LPNFCQFYIIRLYGLQLVFKSVRRRQRIISDAISHGDFNRILYRCMKENHQTLLSFAVLAGKWQKTHLLIWSHL